LEKIAYKATVGFVFMLTCVSHVIDVELADVWEEVLVGEGVAGRRDVVSSPARVFPKNQIALTHK
jgi:hypothetical protein